MACSMSANEDGVKMVRYAAGQIDALCPQVINAARILAARPRVKVVQENMDVFRDAWENQVRILTEAVDDITTIDDFLAVSGKSMNTPRVSTPSRPTEICPSIFVLHPKNVALYFPLIIKTVGQFTLVLLLIIINKFV